MGKVKIQINSYGERYDIHRLECGVQLFSTLTHAKLYAETKQEKIRKHEIHQTFMSDVMQQSPLSEWLELYVYVIFSSVYEAPKNSEREFIQAVSCFHMEALRQEILKQKNKQANDLDLAKKACSSLLTKSFFNLSTFIEEHERATAQAQPLINDSSNRREHTLSSFFMLSRIAYLAEQMPELSSTIFQRCKTYMAHDPFRFMGELAKILKDVVALNACDEEILVMCQLDKIIHAILQLVGFKEDNTAIVFLIRDALFEKNILQFRDIPGSPLEEHSEKHYPSPV